MRPEELAQAAYARARVEVGGDGWEIELEDVHPPWIRLHFNHELSASFTLTLTTERDVLAGLDDALTQPEFRIISQGPRPAPHASLLRMLRQRSGMYGWAPNVLGEVAATLAVLGLLTEAEAEWLRTAGVPWNPAG